MHARGGHGKSECAGSATLTDITPVATVCVMTCDRQFHVIHGPDPPCSGGAVQQGITDGPSGPRDDDATLTASCAGHPARHGRLAAVIRHITLSAGQPLLVRKCGT